MIPLLLFAILLAILGLWPIAIVVAIFAFLWPLAVAPLKVAMARGEPRGRSRAGPNGWLILSGAVAVLVLFSAIRQDGASSGNQGASSGSIVATSPLAKDPTDWFVDVKRDGKTARIASAQGNRDILAAVARSALAYRDQISAWTRTPPAADVYSVCGNMVIALAKVAESPRDALASYDRFEDACRDAITPPIR